jgi:predicted HTH domain antitoxin
MIVPDSIGGQYPPAREPSCSACRGWSSYATASRLGIPQIDMARDECEDEKAICLAGMVSDVVRGSFLEPLATSCQLIHPESMQITVDLPDDIAGHSDPGREALEALAIEGYRCGKLTHYQASQLLGMTRFEFDGFSCVRTVNTFGTYEPRRRQSYDSEVLL